MDNGNLGHNQGPSHESFRTRHTSVSFYILLLGVQETHLKLATVEDS